MKKARRSRPALTIPTRSSEEPVIAPATAVSTADNGAVTFSVTDATGGPVTLTATDTDTGVSLAPITIGFATPVATGASIVAGSTTVTDDGTSSTTVTVYLADALGRPAAGKTVSLAGGGGAVTSPTSRQAVTGSDGVATFTATDANNETAVFTATDTTDNNLPVPGSAVVNFQPAGPSPCVDTPPTPASGSGLSLSTLVSGVLDNDRPFVTFGGGITFTDPACAGVATPAFDSSGNVFLVNRPSGQVYEFGPLGGVAGPGTALPGTHFSPGELVGGMAFGKGGELYVSRYHEGNQTKPEIVQLDTSTGAVRRVVATSAGGLPDFPGYLAVDPISGDLFSLDSGAGAGTGNDNVTRIANPASATPTIGPYANVGGVQTGLTFAPDGTMYVGVLTGPNTNAIVSVAANAGSPGTVTKVATLPNGPFGVGVAGVDAHGHATALIAVEDGGNIDRIDLTASPATFTTIASRPAAFSTGGAIGPDGCLYYNDQDAVLKVTGVTSACSSMSGGTIPQLTLTDHGPAAPSTGSQGSLTAKLVNASTSAGVPIMFTSLGANPDFRLVHSDASGGATFTYPGTFPGVDTVTAFATVDGKALASAPIKIHWRAGKDTSFISLNRSATGGAPGQTTALTANLTDVNTASPIAGASVTITLAGESCTATTDTSGQASCVLTPAALGVYALGASYAGSSAYTPSTTATFFDSGGAGFPTTPAVQKPPPTPAPAPAPAPSPNPPPIPPRVPSRKPIPPPDLGLPSSRACVSRRALLVHVRAPAGKQLARVRFFLNGRARQTLTFKKTRKHPKLPSTVVSLKGLPKGTFTLKLEITTTARTTATQTRTYHTCVARKKAPPKSTKKKT
jgi:hypothetical protein